MGSSKIEQNISEDININIHNDIIYITCDFGLSDLLIKHRHAVFGQALAGGVFESSLGHWPTASAQDTSGTSREVGVLAKKPAAFNRLNDIYMQYFEIL